MKIFNSIGHLFAWVLSKALPSAEKAVTAVATAAASPLATVLATLTGGKTAQVQADIEAIAEDCPSGGPTPCRTWPMPAARWRSFLTGSFCRARALGTVNTPGDSCWATH